ncbi:long-chain fatty acid--CoA ligase [Streptomyces tendae]|uniref:long-chain fatty acid--CoA ligase n=1 Tax=Streptomyces tendae TaxID=1932 RepID=UPI0033E22548
MTTVSELLSTRLREMSAARAHEPALIAVDKGGRETVLNWEELCSEVFGLARPLHEVSRRRPQTVVYLRAPADTQTAIVILACLLASVPVLAISTRADSAFEAAVVAEARRSLGEPVHASHVLDLLAGPSGGAPNDEQAALSSAGKPLFVLTSSGSTGTPKVIPHWRLFGATVRGVRNLMFVRSGALPRQHRLIIASLYHYFPFATLIECVVGGGTAVLQERFVPVTTLDLLAAHHVEWTMLNPFQMGELLNTPGDLASSVVSLNGLLHGAGPCPRHIKYEWLRVLSPHRLFEVYGATEGAGATLASGTEWLERPGTVGRGFFTQVSAWRDDGQPCRPHEVGRVFLRPLGSGEPLRPWLPRRVDGAQSFGDLGWLDDDGYLFIAGRESDQVEVNGESVTPEQVDACIHTLEGVRDVLTFIVEDREGNSVELHAVVVPRTGATITRDAVLDLCRRSLNPSSVPVSAELVSALPRTAVGKIRRRLSQNEYEEMLNACPSAGT